MTKLLLTVFATRAFVIKSNGDSCSVGSFCSAMNELWHRFGSSVGQLKLVPISFETHLCTVANLH
jgi:hypothetical protein